MFLKEAPLGFSSKGTGVCLLKHICFAPWWIPHSAQPSFSKTPVVSRGFGWIPGNGELSQHLPLNSLTRIMLPNCGNLLAFNKCHLLQRVNVYIYTHLFCAGSSGKTVLNSEGWLGGLLKCPKGPRAALEAPKSSRVVISPQCTGHKK